ncbi:xanthine dehydrogenase family protein molybdopterin-binding subunit [Candidatus Poriferisodalis sp.]|uniref:xanthine dehydrogenase family protein molybdopterin-binding subunit n=1 Tax=Candidatus Poriferisodalis sp. TaxID=3101277 RepID=UPI003B01B30B
MSLRGTSVVRREDEPLLRGQGRFVANLAVEAEWDGVVHACYVTSTVAHAVIAGLDVSEARNAHGVVDVVTAADLDLPPYPAPSPAFDPAIVRTLLADDRVRFVGEPVAVVVAETATAAIDAAELVVVDYEPLEALVDPEAALDAPALFEGMAEPNVVLRISLDGEPADFSGCKVVAEVRTVNNRIAPCPLEPRVAASRWADDGRLHHMNAGQGPHPVRAALAKMLGLERDQMRVVSRDVGGSFGAKARPHPEETLLGWLSDRLGRPVMWVPSRSADMVGLVHGRGQIQYCRIGGTAEGRITAFEVRVVQDAGAYGNTGAALPSNIQAMLTGCYDIASLGFSSVSVLTNTTPVGPFRGAGRPEAAAAIERAVDVFAAEVGMDPIDVRRKNFLPPEAFPFHTRTGMRYDTGAYEAGMDAALEDADYAALRKEQARRRADGDDKLLGIGVATYVERTAGLGRSEYGAVELVEGGRIVGRTGSSPYGQGHHTSWAMLISDRTGVPMDRIDIVHGDTDEVPQGQITGGSRSVQLAGTSIWEASGALVDQARTVAATLLEADPADVTLDTGSGAFHVVGTPAVSVDWAAVAEHLATASRPEPGGAHGPRLLHAEETFESEAPTFPFGTHIAVVEVDRHTGEVELQRLVACDDAGVIVNPLLAEGQVHGGLAHGAAQALYEEFVYDDEGNPLTGNFADYAVFSAAEMPFFERVTHETPTHVNPLGAKGLGEAGSVGSTPAVQNAVIDALAHLGIRHLDMPLTPQRVWRAITDATAGAMQR